MQMSWSELKATVHLKSKPRRAEKEEKSGEKGRTKDKKIRFIHQLLFTMLNLHYIKGKWCQTGIIGLRRRQTIVIETWPNILIRYSIGCIN